MNPTVAQKGPYFKELEPSTYYWCSCGDSKNQPFCDGSHSGTEFTPQAFVVEEKKKFYLCGCKHSASKPMCDGSHANIA